MRLPSYKRIMTNDFTSQFQSLVGKLSYSINSAFDSLFQLTQNQINFRDNIACTVASFTVTVDSNGNALQSISLALNVNTSIDGVSVINAVSNSTNTTVYPTGGLFVSWTRSQNNIVIQKVIGLPANTSFTLTIIVYQN